MLQMAKVLVVDDVVANITLLKDSLKSKYEVITAKSGQKALELVGKKWLPDLILLDIMMPDMNGFEVCQRLKSNERTKDIPVIFLTVLDKTDDILEGFNVGGVDYITKPFVHSVLHARIESHLALSRQKKILGSYNRNLEKVINKKTQEIEQQYITDYLTKLPNKIFLDQLMASDNDQTIILLNLDNFRLINQNLGYHIGDKILIEIAKKLKKYRSNIFELCRLQGDEFVFLANGRHLDFAQDIVSAIKEYFINNAIRVEEIELDVTFTIAIDYGTGEDLLKSVSTTIQVLKESGKNRVGIQEHNREFKAQQQNNLYWIKKVKECLREDQVDVFFQPIKAVNANGVSRYEALARIILKDNVIILPERFIKPSILAGVSSQITKRVIDKGFYVLQNTKNHLSLNITQDDLEEHYLLGYLELKRKEYGITSSQVTLEILESISVNTASQSIKQLNELKTYGYQIAIDDFGTEMSNFSRLLSINPDFIKIDGSFIKNIDKDLNSQEIVKTIISFAHKVGSQVIAEFVHNEAVYQKVCELNIDFVQGYYIGKPLPTFITSTG